MGLDVLIVDDASAIGKIVERSLRQAASEEIDSVLEASDDSEALDKLNGSPQVIFSDINMTNLNGIEFLKKLKETGHNSLPVIMVTTEGSEQMVMEAPDLGSKGFIRKPVTPAQMQEALTKALW